MLVRRFYNYWDPWWGGWGYDPYFASIWWDPWFNPYSDTDRSNGYYPFYHHHHHHYPIYGPDHHHGPDRYYGSRNSTGYGSGSRGGSSSSISTAITSNRRGLPSALENRNSTSSSGTSVQGMRITRTTNTAANATKGTATSSGSVNRVLRTSGAGLNGNPDFRA